MFIVAQSSKFYFVALPRPGLENSSLTYVRED